MMDSKTQEKISKLMTEQAEKLGMALNALRNIKRLKHSTAVVNADVPITIAEDAIREISDYGKNPKDL
jgi:2-phospho-L-lactate guanylyltransferase (CobY/MobA/RfbA family)